MALNKQQLEVVNQNNFPDNNEQLITPALLRDFNTDMIDSIQLTGSYATTGSNTFIGNQTITGNLTVSGVISASVLYVQTETASVIYSSGSNQFGDELTDTQTLSGSVKVQGSLTVNGTSVLTSSVGFVSTASFNAYTSSNNQRVSSLEVNSASVNISITNLNSFTASQSTLNGTFATTGSNTFTGNQIIDKTKALYTNALYWTSSEVGYTNLEIINQAGGNLDFASLNGGKMRIVNTPLILTGSALSSSNDISTSANIYGANITGSTINTGSLVTTASFNAYTQSNDIIVNALVVTTNAQQILIGNLNSATASLFTSTSLSLTTASFSGNTLTFTKGNGSTFGVVIPDISGSTIPSGTVSSSAQIVELGFLQTSSFNSYTSSTNSSITQLNASSASQQISIDALNTNSASVNISISNLNSATSSLFGSASLGLVTASVNLNTITFTKGNASTFNITVNTGSAITTDLTSLNAFTQSQYVSNSYFATTASFNSYTQSTNIRLNNLESTSASVNISISNLNSTTSSFATSITNLNTATASFSSSINQLNASSASQQISIDAINAVSNSWVTESETGSFARTNAANTFTADQTIASANNLIVSGSLITFNGMYIPAGILNSAIQFSSPNSNLRIDNASLNVDNTFTASLQEGYVWVGDASGKTVTVATSSFASIASGSVPAGTISSSAQITSLGFVSSSVTASSLVTASFSGNTLTFTKGDASTFGVQIPDVSGSTIPAGTVSSSAQIVAYNIFATTGSNTFSGSQFITGGVQIKEYIQTGPNQLSLETEYAIKTNRALLGNGFILSGSQSTEALNIYYRATRWQHAGDVLFTNQINPVPPYTNSGSIQIYALNGANLELTGSQLNLSGVDFIPFSASLNTRILAAANTGSFATTGSNVFTGDQTLVDSAGNSVTLTDVSGSLMLVAKSFTSASAHLTSSAANFVNLIFKNNSNIADTIISGSNNIFTNPQTTTAGYKRYLGGSNNLHLNNTSGIAVQITASAASVSGNTPSMNNNIFQGVGPFNINQAVNTGVHDYSQNFYNGGGTTTINALGFTGSLSFNNNFSINSTATINAASASLAEIASGLSGSGTLTITSNASFGGTMTNTSPRLPGFAGQSMNNNVIAGGAITVTNISSSGAVNSNNNFANSALSYTNAGAAGLGVHTGTAAITNNYGGGTIIASGSAVAFNFNTTSGNNLTLTNRAFSGSLGVGQFVVSRNIFYGQSGILLITGSVDGTGNTTGAFTDNAVIGKSNTIFSNQSGAGLHNSFISNVVGGENLIISASNSFNSTIGGGAYFGRYNANDGVRNKTGQTVFLVGTGTSTARKTGFLIDSGSNSFFEGTLNVSGSTVFTGSVKVAPTFQLNLPTGSNQQVGTAVLDGASPSLVVVSNSLVTADSTIMLTKQTLTNSHMVAVSSKGAGTFTITSNGNGDTDTVGWFIINNS